MVRFWKKLLVSLLAVVLILIFSSCNNVKSSESSEINVAFLKGPTSLGALKFIDDSNNKSSENGYNVSIFTDPSQVLADIANGTLDIAALPTNSAASLYNKTDGDVIILALNTLGVLYIVSDESENVKSISDLKGKTLYISGEGSVPEYALDFILKGNGIDPGSDLNIEYKTEHSELASLMISGRCKLAMLPEPFVTQVKSKNPSVISNIDLSQEWDKVVDNKSALAMGCIVARKDFVKNKEVVSDFLNKYRKSIEFTNSNINEAAELSEKYDVMPKDVAKKSIPNCNIVYVDGEEMKLKIDGFLSVLFGFDPNSIGGKLPGEDFYYKK